MSCLVVFVTAYWRRDHLKDTSSSWWFVPMATLSFGDGNLIEDIRRSPPGMYVWKPCKYGEKWDKLWPGARFPPSVWRRKRDLIFSWSFFEDPIIFKKQSDSCVPLKTTWSKLHTEKHGSLQLQMEPPCCVRRPYFEPWRQVECPSDVSNLVLSIKIKKQIRHFVLAEQTLARLWKCRLYFHTGGPT